MLDIQTLEKFDKNGMHKIYDIWPQIAREQFEVDLEPVNFDKVSHIVFAGMGGSGAISDIFSSILSKTNVHVEVVKGYLLPRTVDSKTLVVTTSISGNTDETLTILDSAKSKAKVIAFSNRGKIENFCLDNNIKHCSIPMYHSSRASFPSFLYAMLKVLQPILPIKKEEIIDSIVHMEKLNKQINSTNLLSTENLSLNLAEWIDDIPLIYYPWGLRAAAIRFKNSLQENSKSHAFIEDVIEACHNGIVSWEKISNIKPILLEGADDHFKTKERWKILREYFEENHIDYREVFSIEGGILSKLINLTYLLDYSTIYLAALRNIDPSPVKSIDFIKRKL